MRNLTVMVLVLAAAPLATSGLLVDPTGGNSVGFPAGADDEHVARSIGGQFPLFGFGIQSLVISSNGFMGTGGGQFGFFSDNDLAHLVSITQGPVIAALFDDLIVGNVTSVTDRSITNTLYAVTFQTVFGINDSQPEHGSDFQMALFMANTTIGTFHFVTGDIGISYGALGSSVRGASFTVGVATNNRTTGTPDSADGQLSNFNALPTGSQFFLYRPNSEGGYDVSIQDTGVPEPATLALGGFGLAAVAFLKRKARSSASRPGSAQG